MDILSKANLAMEFETITGKTVSVSKDSNEVITKKMSDLFAKVLTSAEEYIFKGENLEITATLTNGSELEISALTLKVTLNEATTFVAGSVVVDDVPQEEADILTGVELSNMATSDVHTVKFMVNCSDETTEPFATLTGTVNYSVVDPIEGEKQLEENTNSLDVEVVEVDITILNAVDKGCCIPGNNLHYTITITNGAETLKTNLLFTNPIPTGTTFVEGSVKVDDTEQADFNPETGFALEDLATEGTVKIEFDVLVE